MSSCRWPTRRPRTTSRRSATQRESFNDLPYAIDARRLHQTMSWVVYFSMLSRFGPHRGRCGVSERARSRRWREVARTDAVAAMALSRCRLASTPSSWPHESPRVSRSFHAGLRRGDRDPQETPIEGRVANTFKTADAGRTRRPEKTRGPFS